MDFSSGESRKGRLRHQPPGTACQLVVQLSLTYP
jgi:hypothetical protein